MHYTSDSKTMGSSPPGPRAPDARSAAARSRATDDAAPRSEREEKRALLLRGLGAAVRARRGECGLTLRALAQLAHVSERFLVQLETGDGNISVARLQD